MGHAKAERNRVTKQAPGPLTRMVWAVVGWMSIGLTL